MSRLLVVRHGESEWNAEGRWQGHSDPPLSARGVRQARRAARALQGVKRVASSDLQRAHETALVLAAELGVGEVTVHPALRERDVGECAGLTFAEVERAFPGFRSGGAVPPGWEADEQLLARVLPALVALGAEGASDAIVVSHGGVIRTLERHLGDSGEGTSNLEGRWIEVRDGEVRLAERVALVDEEVVSDVE